MTELTYQAVRHAQETVEQMVQEAAAEGHPIPEAVATAMQCQLILHPSLISNPQKLRLAAEVALEVFAEGEWNRIAGRLLAN